jgi:GDP-D-mannose 3', 5'-epimerase
MPLLSRAITIADPRQKPIGAIVRLASCLRLMCSDFAGPVNIGSDEMVSIDDLAGTIIEIAGKRLDVNHVPGPLGVRGRNSDSTLIREKLGWQPTQPLKRGLAKTYSWIADQVKRRHNRH